MSRLVVVSNRIAIPNKSKSSAGGLAVGIMDALKNTSGLWFGWSGEISEISGEEEEELDIVEKDGITYATVPLNQNDYDLYYCQFSNAVIWPAFHYRIDLVDFQREAWEGYCRVNDLLARQLQPLIKPDDILWIHDYHLLPFAAALRKIGVTNRIGFFLHIPFPTPEVFNALPTHKELLEMMCEYDLLGFQTETDRNAFVENLDQLTPLEDVAPNTHRAFGHTFKTEVYPISIAPDSIKQMAEGPLPPKIDMMKRELSNAKNIISCERLDYTKGLPERFLAFEALLEHYPQHRGKVRYSQIAPTSRGDVQAYQDLRHQLEMEVGRINGKYGSLNSTPLYYLNQHFDRRLLMKIFRLTDVGLVTPLRDGMNLVAKEYIAAQDPEDPGVLVLSRFTGAANEMTGALIVNPYDRDEVAAALDQALTMGREERISRYNEMMKILRENDIAHWGETYLKDLRALPERGSEKSSTAKAATP
ncbi:alpha,alpha-trehalose-phosphate synthase [Rouxiella badensis]|jgi:trehalose 6-phosphate synthase|uniref:Trehalose-6-phosphate synthase n=1 Tax=Rouxiella badensis TaxID=1646377 RepID=A0A1X0WJL1_9GAMM|nr:alpha,alpha-trehalose-phosphate synthase [Rouxiella badensis]MCC3702545.1 alpha,alpha-trehalose-phosphate synthase [Rouxiella badensis]MCC3718728.1 alpha,alpha-trehalose-phosphate synthase [Rouxiella badensis]MCC3727933.1 alpha,alpha-trehalose-phosphate synthase [Rouxiella badensis]MCC3732899.1 alpha,alpha-trehalose-phosphate synthase [Rouxiella badensis]MCC3739677.1 alpha,alpha-trehalose-phosphate synthase [Rouxiella badensis]